jgi:glycosyltransferase involved in cell wall biosynthesis
MIHGKKIVVVLPAYNAAKTLEQTYSEIPFDIVDNVILVDDYSQDETVEIASKLNLKLIVHDHNKGYGGNQKTCYKEALNLKADVVIMLHPDYQYTPKLIGAMASLVAIGQYDMVLASRIITDGAIRGGMPIYKYFSNRILTFIENILLHKKFSEYHTGYRAFSKRLLLDLPYERNSNGFTFDNELIVQAIYFGFTIGEISCPAKYFPEASSINFGQSLKYGLGVLRAATLYRFARWRLAHPKFLKKL